MTEDEKDRLVRIAVGFATAKEAGKNGLHRPFEIYRRRTRIVIQKEDKRPKNEWDDLQELLDWQDAHDERPAKDGSRFLVHWVDLRCRGFYAMEDDDEQTWTLRHVGDIVRHTTDADQATEWLNVHDSNWEGERKPKSQWTQAKQGWNKQGDSIVILHKEFPKPYVQRPKRLTWVLPRAYFDIYMSCFLAAMAPDQPNRILVIQYAIRKLLEFEQYQSQVRMAETKRLQKRRKQRGLPPMDAAWIERRESKPITPVFHGTPQQVERRKEWFCHHILRRMFRMRFGCSMTEGHDEPAGALSTFQTSKDTAFKHYKTQARAKG